MKHDEDREIRKFYGSYLARELRDPEVAGAKKRLIETYFPKETFAFPFGWAVPAAGLIMLCILVFPVYHTVRDAWFQTQPAGVETAAVSEAPLEQIPFPAAEPVPEPAPVLSPVMVKSAGSDIGQIMIYKQSHQNNPVTIVWVFSGGQ